MNDTPLLDAVLLNDRVIKHMLNRLIHHLRDFVIDAVPGDIMHGQRLLGGDATEMLITLHNSNYHQTKQGFWGFGGYQVSLLKILQKTR